MPVTRRPINKKKTRGESQKNYYLFIIYGAKQRACACGGGVLTFFLNVYWAHGFDGGEFASSSSSGWLFGLLLLLLVLRQRGGEVVVYLTDRH